MDRRMHSNFLAILIANLILLSLVSTPAIAMSALSGAQTLTNPSFQVTRVSVASDGTQGNDDSGVFGSYISGNGRYVVFGSLATNLVANDTNNQGDVFAYDMFTGHTERVSVSSATDQGNGFSGNGAAITKDGRYIAFSSQATNLVSNDTNGHQDIFVRDTQTGTTQIASVASDGTQGNGDSGYSTVAISDDGRYVAFYSIASNLVANDTNNKDDVFVHDMQTGATRRVSVSSAGTQGNDHSFIDSISSDGKYVLFDSMATNLDSRAPNGGLFLYNMQTAQIDWAASGAGGTISDDDRYIAFYSVANSLVPGDTNGVGDVFVYDRQNSLSRFQI